MTLAPYLSSVFQPASSWDERLAQGERNAFDAVRLILASLVVLEHSYFLIDGTSERDPLYLLTYGQTNCGHFAVVMFFVLSGFLVTHSLLQSKSIVYFLLKRVARIVPAFLLASAIGCLVVGSLAASDPLSYLEAQNWYRIAVSVLALKQVGVIGALEGNRLELVNGTLWTIKYEFDCYLALALLGAAGLLRPVWRPVVYTCLAAVLAVSMARPLPAIDYGVPALLVSSPDKWPGLFPFFIVGSAFYLWRERIPKSPVLFTVALTWLVASAIMGGMFWALLFAGSYAVLFVSLSAAAELKLFGRRVDLSYGLYLYGWPIQQLLLYWSGQRLSPLVLFVTALACSYVIAWASWTVVERPSLDLVHHSR